MIRCDFIGLRLSLKLAAILLISVIPIQPLLAKNDENPDQISQSKLIRSYLSFPFAFPAVIGQPVESVDYSWQIGLEVDVPGYARPRRCGGILISTSIILTAAHCVDRWKAEAPGAALEMGLDRISAFRARESFGGQALDLDVAFGVRIHPSYKVQETDFQYDAALLRLASPIKGATTAPVRRRLVNAAEVGRAVVSGWGLYSDNTSGTLRAAVVPLAESRACQAEASDEFKPSFTDATICTLDPEIDACRGDSGGPLVIGSRDAPQTIGIVSFGSAADCGRPNAGKQLVGGYTRASLIVDWIIGETGDRETYTTKQPDQLMDVYSKGLF